MPFRVSFASLTIAACLSGAGVVSAQTVDELVAKNIEAKGGAAKINALTTMRMTGTVMAQALPTPIPITLTFKRPNMVRQEIRIQDQRFAQAFDGEHGWMINPFSGTDEPQELPAIQGDMMREQADFAGPLIDYKAKGHTVELAGPDTVQGKKAHKLKVTRKSGQVQYVYLDAETGLELKTLTDIEGPGGKAQIESLPSDYRSEDGLMIPHSIRTLMNGQQMAQIAIDRIEVGVPIDDSAFKMPAKAPVR